MTSSHILIAEDEKHSCLALSLVLKKAGYEVTAVENGLEALNRAITMRNSPNPVSLLVLDIQMPGLTGLELLYKLRERDLSVPVLIISGYRDIEIAGELKSAFLIDFLQKPFVPGQLLKRVERLLYESQAAHVPQQLEAS
jgi:two-component system response regulator AauR